MKFDTDLSIQTAQFSDWPTLVALEQSLFQYDIISPRQMKFLLQRPSAVVRKAELDGHLVGSMILLTRKNSSILRLYSLGVRKQEQHLGIGRRLLLDAETMALEKRCNCLRLELHINNQIGLSFYLKAGFQIFTYYDNYYNDGATALRLQKVL